MSSIVGVLLYGMKPPIYHIVVATSDIYSFNSVWSPCRVNYSLYIEFGFVSGQITCPHYRLRH